MEIYERIKLRRKELGLSAEKVAEELGVSPATIYRYEKKDIKKFPTEILEPLSKVLRTTPAYLMGWADDVSNYTDAELDRQIIEVFNRLSEEKQKQALDYLAFLASQD